MRTGVPIIISAACLEGSDLRTCDLTLDEIVSNDPKLSELKKLTRANKGASGFFLLERGAH